MSKKNNIPMIDFFVTVLLKTGYEKKVTLNFLKIISAILILVMQCFMVFGTDSYNSFTGNDNHSGTQDKMIVTVERAYEESNPDYQKKINGDYRVDRPDVAYEIRKPVIYRSSELKNDEGFPYPVSKIYATDEYSAFTDLIRFNDFFYCSFRVGSAHVGGQDGKVRIIRSVDGIRWENIALLEKYGIDLRDPKLSVTPDNKLMVIMGGSVYQDRKLLERRPQVSFSDSEGRVFSNPEEVTIKPEGELKSSWIWMVDWHRGIGYGIDYQTKVKDHWNIFLMKTKDGKTFKKVVRLEVDGQPNEATIRFDEYNLMYVLIRREGDDKRGVLAKSPYPYSEWTYHKLDCRLGGPNFLFLNDYELVIGTRKYADKVKTQILVTDLIGNVKKEIILPSGGDTSYPGLVIFDDKLWVSYYSSHEGNANIYLAKIPLSELKEH